MALPAHAESQLFLIYAYWEHRLVYPMLEQGRGLRDGEMEMMTRVFKEEEQSYGLVDRALAQEWEATCGACFDLADELE